MTTIDVDHCVIGAGYAGLTAAYRLTQAGNEVAVLEARNRVGGRVWSEHLADGTPVDPGGTFIGPDHKNLLALMKEMGVETIDTFCKEQWTRGCHMAHYPTGILTNFGRALREPTGRIHWATTETSPAWVGNIDGAVGQGERVAQEVMAAKETVKAR